MLAALVDGDVVGKQVKSTFACCMGVGIFQGSGQLSRRGLLEPLNDGFRQLLVERPRP